MATNKNENTAPEAAMDMTNPNRLVEIHIPRGQANDEPNLLVSVNGKNFLLPRGKTSTVPAYIADEIKRSWRAQEKRDERAEAMREQAKAPVA